MAERNHKMHVTETPDTSHIKNIDVTHEKSDVQVGSIAKFVIGLLVLTIATHIVLWGMFWALQKSELKKEQQVHRSPLAAPREERLPPEPRLQSAPGFAETLQKTQPQEHAPKPTPVVAGEYDAPKGPLWEIDALRKQWNHVLQHGPTDANGQRYGMPIEQAKQEALRQLTAKKQP